MGLLNIFPVDQLQLDGNYLRGPDGLIYFGIVSSIPADGGTGYGYGCILINSATAGVYINTDTDATCDFDAQAATALTSGAVSLEHLDSGIAPSHMVVYAGANQAWTGGGASLAKTVTGVAATDVVMVTLRNDGTENVTLLTAIPTTNTITVTLSAANTSNDVKWDYVVFRAAS